MCIDGEYTQLRSKKMQFERIKLRHRNRSGDLMPLVAEIARLDAIINADLDITVGGNRSASLVSNDVGSHAWQKM